MIQITLDVNEKIRIGDNIVLYNLKKIHPKAINANVVKIGIDAPISINIRRGELKKYYKL